MFDGAEFAKPVRLVTAETLPVIGRRPYGRWVGVLCALAVWMIPALPVSSEGSLSSSGRTHQFLWESSISQIDLIATGIFAGIGALALTGALLRSPARGVLLLLAGLACFCTRPAMTIVNRTYVGSMGSRPDEMVTSWFVLVYYAAATFTLGGLWVLLRRPAERIRRRIVLPVCLIAVGSLLALVAGDLAHGTPAWPPTLPSKVGLGGGDGNDYLFQFMSADRVEPGKRLATAGLWGMRVGDGVLALSLAATAAWAWLRRPRLATAALAGGAAAIGVRLVGWFVFEVGNGMPFSRLQGMEDWLRLLGHELWAPMFVGVGLVLLIVAYESFWFRDRRKTPQPQTTEGLVKELPS